jgi:transposase
MLVKPTVAERMVKHLPQWLIGDGAYDSDRLDGELIKQEIEMIVPHKWNRKQENKTQDGRKLRRYKKRWVVERFFAWLQNYRKNVVRYEYYLENYVGFVQLASAM